MGKTRLALEVVARVEGGFASGAAVLDLAPLTDPALVADLLAQRLAGRRFFALPPLERVARHVADRPLLLLLDNFEQVIAAATDVGRLLHRCPRLTVVVTSREALHLTGEHEFPAAPLAVPDPAQATDPAALQAVPAVALFVARAQAVWPEFVLTRENGAAVAEVCTRLDGLPLTIELAAARVKVFSPAALRGQLAQRLPLLVAGPRDAPERHRTLRAAIAWSEELLDPAERRVFRRLAVFVGGFTLRAAEAVADDDPDVPLVDRLAALVDRSLLRHIPDGEEPRFRMLETIREYAWERLVQAGEADRLRDRHLDYFLRWAEQGRGRLNAAEAVAWSDLLARDYDNLRAALAWAEQRENVNGQLRLAGAICRFWALRGHVGEGYRWVDAALAASAGAPVETRAKFLHAKAPSPPSRNASGRWRRRACAWPGWRATPRRWAGRSAPSASCCGPRTLTAPASPRACRWPHRLRITWPCVTPSR
ncbi:MAG: hypothetical protein QN139_13065 [Armatimonadota bacterium]|nr:hypothetical protein [Armatimonadota bacterium]